MKNTPKNTGRVSVAISAFRDFLLSVKASVKRKNRRDSIERIAALNFIKSKRRVRNKAVIYHPSHLCIKRLRERRKRI